MNQPPPAPLWHCAGVPTQKTPMRGSAAPIRTAPSDRSRQSKVGSSTPPSPQPSRPGSPSEKQGEAGLGNRLKINGLRIKTPDHHRNSVVQRDASIREAVVRHRPAPARKRGREYRLFRCFRRRAIRVEDPNINLVRVRRGRLDEGRFHPFHSCRSVERKASRCSSNPLANCPT